MAFDFNRALVVAFFTVIISHAIIFVLGTFIIGALHYFWWVIEMLTCFFLMKGIYLQKGIELGFTDSIKIGLFISILVIGWEILFWLLAMGNSWEIYRDWRMWIRYCFIPFTVIGAGFTHDL